MKQFWAFVNKEFYHIWRDPRTMLILLAMPIVQIILFGFAINTEITNVRVAVYNPSKDYVSQELVQRIEASSYFSLVGSIDKASDIEKYMRDGTADMILVFPSDFYKSLVSKGSSDLQLVIDASNPNNANIINGYTSIIVSQYQQELNRSLSQGKKIAILPQVKQLYNPQMKGAYNFVPGTMGMIILLICAMMTSVSITREKERGTMEVLLVSPIRPMWIVVAKMVPYFVLSFFNLISILLLSVFVLGVPVQGSFLFLFFFSSLFILVALNLGLVISNVAPTQMAALLISGMLLMLPVMLLSGMLFPIESMPLPLQWFSSLIPARWFIAGVRKSMIMGLSPIHIWEETLILTVMVIVLLVISLKKFKIRL